MALQKELPSIRCAKKQLKKKQKILTTFKKSKSSSHQETEQNKRSSARTQITGGLPVMFAQTYQRQP